MVKICPIMWRKCRKFFQHSLKIPWKYLHLFKEYTVSEKAPPFYFCDIFDRFYPILQSLVRNIPQGIEKKTCVHRPTDLTLRVHTKLCKKNFRLQSTSAQCSWHCATLSLAHATHCGHQRVPTWNEWITKSGASCRSASTARPYSMLLI